METNRIENKAMMRIYRDLEMVEQLGSGLPRILQAYGEECFYFSENYIRMSFPAISLHLTQRTVQRYLKQLQAKGIIERIGSGIHRIQKICKGYWKVKE
ncbi:hypothetical protein [Sphingobacterium sp. SGG-5]|uniref:hypothetical protein n=1 Tax=Sphingobacterium sp. SGG-5 TaxID=2710881 RepID=UPI0019D0D7BE|nr:hypothetical protein [Sphingobacterium sp. SGG-5]